MRGGFTKGERTLREDWPVVDSSWRRAGVEELPCELVREQRFLGSGVPVKQLRSWRKGMGVERKRERDWDGVEKVGRTRSVPGTPPDPSHCTTLGKTPFTKKAHEKTHVHRGKCNGRPQLPGWPGKDGTAQTLGKAWLL
jgi:hypothetical protein